MNIEYCTCFYIILLYPILVNSDKVYYPQIFSEECKDLITNRKIKNTVTEDLELRESDNESDSEFDD